MEQRCITMLLIAYFYFKIRLSFFEITQDVYINAHVSMYNFLLVSVLFKIYKSQTP